MNFTAFPTRLIMICHIRAGSPINVSGTSGRTSNSNSSPFSWARNDNVLMVLPIVSRRSKSISSSSNWPASTFEKSRMSLMIFKSASAEYFTPSR